MTDQSASTLHYLERLYNGEITLDDLRDCLAHECEKSPTAKTEILGILESERAHGRIPPAIHQILMAGLKQDDSGVESPTLIGTPASKSPTHLDAETVMASAASTGASRLDAHTVIASTDSDSQPTFMVSPESRNSSDLAEGKTRGDTFRPSSNTAPNELKPGSVLKDQYVIESTLGAGGMGMVFKARDLLMEEMKDREPYVAIKVLRPEYQGDQTLLISLQREFRKAQKLSHPNIVGMMDFTRDQSSGAVFITMQYLKGRTLGDLIQEKFPNGMPLEKAIPIIRGMASALDYAHRQNIIHLDFKPGNVFICENGDVKVLDFGIAGFGDAKTQDQEKTVFNALDLGALTPSYASLEMIDHHGGGAENYRPDPKDDVYALGCVVYELLTGRHPYGRASAKDAFLSGLSAKEPSGLGKRRWSQLKRALAFSRAERLESVEALLKTFEPFSLITPKTLGALVVTSALTVAGFKYFQQPAMECQSPVLSEADTLKVKDLLEVAAVDMDVGYLTSPPASNALLAYQEVLKLDPCNLDAAGGLAKIAAAVEQEGWAAFEGGDTQLALEKVTDGLKAAPHHEGLLALKKKLTQSSVSP